MPRKKRRPNPLQPEIDSFYRSIRARAILIAVEWAGSATALAELLGYDKYTGMKWVQRGRLPPWVAIMLAGIPGCPLTAEEMCPGPELDRYKYEKCPGCGKTFMACELRAGSSPLLKADKRRQRRKRLAEIEERAKRKAQDHSDLC